MSDRSPRLLPPADLAHPSLSPRTARLYSSAGNHLERLLAQAGTGLTTCNEEQLAAVAAEWMASSASARNQILCALPHIWRALGRTDPPDKVAAIGRRISPPKLTTYAPLVPGEAEALEAAAVAVGGQVGLMVLVALHGSFWSSEMCRLRWEDLDETQRVWWVRSDDGRCQVKIAERLCQLLPAARPATGWVFVGRWTLSAVGPR